MTNIGVTARTSRPEILLVVQATLLGVEKLLKRAHDGVDTKLNIECASMWLKISATQLDELLEEKRDKAT